MPLFEYECRRCGHQFEVLVTGSRRPTCPECGSEDLEKRVSPVGFTGAAGGRPSGAASGCGGGRPGGGGG